MASTSVFWNTLFLSGLALVLYIAVLTIYRLYFSPLAKFPGPRLAAATYLVEIYYELFNGEGGQFAFVCRDWHDKYGPIIRINPDELHIRDSAWHETMYSPSRPVSKFQGHANRFGNPMSTVATVPHDQHRLRRAALNPFFSKRNIATFSPQIQQSMTHILARLEREYLDTGKVLNIDKMWGCLACDSIVSLAFERGYHFIDSPDFHSAFNEAVYNLLEPVHFITHVPFLATLLQALPDRIVTWLQPQMSTVIEFQQEMFRQINQARAAVARGEKAGNTLFNSLLQDQDLPPAELTAQRLQQEAVSIVGAGVETVSRTLTVATFHILAQPAVHERLAAELHAAIPNPAQIPVWDALARLPFLAACIAEALRLSYGVSQRLPRAFPDAPLRFREWVIPANTMVSMDNYDVAHDEVLFPDSHSFVPDRWLDSPSAPDGKLLARYLVAFGKGTRSCVGMQLAYAELYIGLANFFRSPLAASVKLFETDKSDIELARDRIAPRARLSSKGVRVVFEPSL